MSSPTDQQLIQFIGQGRRDALAQLFDRYSADLYDYLARLVGDRDQAARLLQTVLLRVPGAAAGFQARDSVRGWLYSLAREAGLDWLRQRGWLDGLPPSDEPIAPGLVGDVWKAARAMPAFFRAVLITEELQPLSPTEKARALGVNRTDLPRLIEEARRSFNRIYDAQARSEGRPTSDRIDPDAVWSARRRLPVEGGSLFGFLPPIPLPDSLQQQIRRQVVEAMSPPPARPVSVDRTAEATAAAAAAGAAAAVAAAERLANQPPAQPPTTPPAQLPPPQQPPALPPRYIPVTPPAEPEAPAGPLAAFGGLPMTAIAALIGVALALLICGGVFLLTQNRGKPIITTTQPTNGQTVQLTPEITVAALFSSDREIDQTRSTMQINGRPVTPLFVNNSIAWTGHLDAGAHTVAVVVVDRAGNSTQQTWNFFIVPGGTPVPPTSTGTITPIVPVTAQIASVTPIVLTATFTPPAPTVIPFNSVTPCSRGQLAGLTFNDLNGNGSRDGNEPGLAGVVVNLTAASNSVVAVSVTDTFGNYRFNDVPFGQYRVVANTPAGWYPTAPTSIAVNIFGCGTITGFNFGFVQSAPPTTASPTTSPTPIVITATFTPSPSPSITTIPPPFTVTNVTASVAPPSSTTCPQTFVFSGTITATGSGPVTYQWIRYDGTLGPAQVLNFAGSGTQNVAPDSLTLGAPGLVVNGWERVQVLSPNVVSSPQANFTLNCPSPNTPTPTQTPTPSSTPTPTLPPFAVTNVTAAVTPSSSTACPQTFTFTGNITVTGTGNVTYQWVRSDGAFGPTQVLTFGSPGMQPANNDTWTLGEAPFVFSGWERIHIVAPNVTDSPQANFSLNCPVTSTPTTTPTPGPSPSPT